MWKESGFVAMRDGEIRIVRHLARHGVDTYSGLYRRCDEDNKINSGTVLEWLPLTSKKARLLREGYVKKTKAPKPRRGPTGDCGYVLGFKGLLVLVLRGIAIDENREVCDEALRDVLAEINEDLKEGSIQIPDDEAVENFRVELIVWKINTVESIFGEVDVIPVPEAVHLWDEETKGKYTGPTPTFVIPHGPVVFQALFGGRDHKRYEKMKPKILDYWASGYTNPGDFYGAQLPTFLTFFQRHFLRAVRAVHHIEDVLLSAGLSHKNLERFWRIADRYHIWKLTKKGLRETEREFDQKFEE